MKNQIFIDNVNMQTETIYMKNGNVHIYPCGFDKEHCIVSGGHKVSQKGKMVTEDDGTSRFHPYAKGSGSRYTTLWVERYGKLKLSKTRLVMTISVPLTNMDPMGEVSFEAEQMKPENTDSQVIFEIERAIRSNFNSKL